ncbi:MAG: hypothetical protein ACN6OR_05690, partial [Stenotrophomonas sp.]
GKGIAIEDLNTSHGMLSYTLQRSDKQLTLQVSEGLRLPAAGLLLQWPYEGSPGEATINGEPAQWLGNELHVGSLPAKVEIEIPAELRRSERSKR